MGCIGKKEHVLPGQLGERGVRKDSIHGKSADTKHVFELKIKSLVNCSCVCMYLKCFRTENSTPPNQSHCLTTATRNVNDAT